MKRITTALVTLGLLAAGLTAATAVAGQAPLSLLQQTTTTATTATTATTTTTTTTTTPPTPTTPRPRQPVFITICHHAPPGNAQRRRGTVRHITLRIRARSVAGHIGARGHGDSLGNCTSQRARTLHSSRAHVKRWHPRRTLRAELRARGRRP